VLPWKLVRSTLVSRLLPRHNHLRTDYSGMIVSSRVILGLGVGLEGGTVPVYVAETVERRIRGNLVSLYQFNIALGEGNIA